MTIQLNSSHRVQGLLKDCPYLIFHVGFRYKTGYSNRKKVGRGFVEKIETSQNFVEVKYGRIMTGTRLFKYKKDYKWIS